MIQLFIIAMVNSEHYKQKLPKVINIKSTILVVVENVL